MTTLDEPKRLVKIHRYDYSVAAMEIMNDLEQPHQVHVYHRQRQPDLPSKIL